MLPPPPRQNNAAEETKIFFSFFGNEKLVKVFFQILPENCRIRLFIFTCLIVKLKNLVTIFFLEKDIAPTES